MLLHFDTNYAIPAAKKAFPHEKRNAFHFYHSLSEWKMKEILLISRAVPVENESSFKLFSNLTLG